MPVRGTGINGAVTLADVINYQNSLPGADQRRAEDRAAASLIHGPLAPEIRAEEARAYAARGVPLTAQGEAAIDARLARRGVNPSAPAVSRPAAGPDTGRIRQIMALSPDERRTLIRQEQENATASDGPPKGSVLQGRQYAPDNVPIEDMTPEQRRLSTYVPGAASSGGAPRAVRGGRFVIDSSAGDGEGAPVPRAPDYNAVAEGRNSVRQKAAAYGIDITKYDPNNPGDQAALETDVRREEQRHQRLTNSATGLYETRELPDGGHRYAPNERGRKMMADKNREMLLNNQWGMYSREARQAGLTFEDFANKYDKEGAAGLRSLTQVLRNNQQDDRRDNVRQRAENANMARLMGTTPGHVAAYNELQNAANSGNPQRMQAALAGMHAIAPHLGFGNMAVAYGQQQADMKAAENVANASKKDDASPIAKSGRDLAAINEQPFSAGRVGNYRLHYRQTLPPGSPADPIAENRHVVAHGAGGAREAAMNPDRSEAEMDGLRDWTDAYHQSGNTGSTVQMQYRGWARRLGLDPKDKKNMALYQQLTDNNPQGMVQWADDMTGNVGSAVAGAIGSMFGGTAPTARAEGGKPKKPAKKKSEAPKKEDEARAPRRPFTEDRA